MSTPPQQPRTNEGWRKIKQRLMLPVSAAQCPGLAPTLRRTRHQPPQTSPEILSIEDIHLGEFASSITDVYLGELPDDPFSRGSPAVVILGRPRTNSVPSSPPRKSYLAKKPLPPVPLRASLRNNDTASPSDPSGSTLAAEDAASGSRPSSPISIGVPSLGETYCTNDSSEFSPDSESDDTFHSCLSDYGFNSDSDDVDHIIVPPPDKKPSDDDCAAPKIITNRARPRNRTLESLLEHSDEDDEEYTLPPQSSCVPAPRPRRDRTIELCSPEHIATYATEELSPLVVTAGSMASFRRRSVASLRRANSTPLLPRRERNPTLTQTHNGGGLDLRRSCASLSRSRPPSYSSSQESTFSYHS